MLHVDVFDSLKVLEAADERYYLAKDTSQKSHLLDKGRLGRVVSAVKRL